MTLEFQTQLFLFLFVFFFLAEFFLNVWLDVLNKKSILKNQKVPDFFKDKVDDETYSKSQEYTLTKLNFNKWELIIGSSLTLLVLFSGVLPWYNNLLMGTFSNPIFQGSFFLFGLMIALSLLKMPLAIYNTFGIEGRFGFNKMTFGLYIKDQIKAFILSLVIGLPFLMALLWFLNYSGTSWWIWTFFFISGFQILLIFIFPTFIAPLFNKFKPLDEGELKKDLLSMAEKLAFKTSGIFVMDGSKRSSHSNAYFTGFGKLRRIVLYDTLIDQMSKDELKGVLCHEIGHYKKGHIYKTLLTSFLFQAIGLFILSLAIQWKPLYLTFGFEQNPELLKHVGLFLFMTSASTFSFLLGPFMNYRSRKHEYEADAYSVENTNQPVIMESALLKLSEKNLSNLTPHPWYSAFHYSHPTIYERILAIRGI